MAYKLYNEWWFWFCVIIVVLFVGGLIYQLFTGFTKTITVSKTYTDIVGGRYSSSSRYMVVDTNNNIYNFSDVWWRGDFNRVEEWNELKPGKKYRVNGWGYRVQWLGQYPQIYSAVPSST